MNKDFSDITMVVDRSGSMSSCQAEAENGINHFVSEQKRLPGKANLTLVQFDTHYEFIHNGVDIQSVGAYALHPRGWTALLDAVGRAVVETGERLAAMPEADRPALVVFVIVTDGGENSSKEYTLDRIKAMIVHQQNEYNWQFTFLGANQDAFQAGTGMGIKTTGIANFVAKNHDAAYAAASANVGRMRQATQIDAAVECAYTDEERKLMGGNS